MPQRAATIESLPMAFEVVKTMQADGLEWGESYRPLGRRALAEIIEGRMAEAVDCWLDSLDGSAMRDRRNGFYSRHLLTELGAIELSVPRTRRFCPTGVLRSHAMRAAEADRAILAGFVLGLSTRKVGEVLLSLLGHKVFAARRETVEIKSGKRRIETACGVTSLDPEAASPERMLTLNRGHWTIAATHRILEWSFDEDRSPIRTGHGPENMTRLRRFAIGLIQGRGRAVAETMRNLARNPRRVLDFLKMTANVRQRAAPG